MQISPISLKIKSLFAVLNWTNREDKLHSETEYLKANIFLFGNVSGNINLNFEVINKTVVYETK